MAKQRCKTLAVKFPMAIFVINFGVRIYILMIGSCGAKQHSLDLTTL